MEFGHAQMINMNSDTRPVLGYGIKLSTEKCISLLKILNINTERSPEKALADKFGLQCNEIDDITSVEYYYLIGTSHTYENSSACILADATDLIKLNQLIVETGYTKEPAWFLGTSTK